MGVFRVQVKNGTTGAAPDSACCLGLRHADRNMGAGASHYHARQDVYKSHLGPGSYDYKDARSVSVSPALESRPLSSMASSVRRWAAAWVGRRQGWRTEQGVEQGVGLVWAKGCEEGRNGEGMLLRLMGWGWRLGRRQLWPQHELGEGRGTSAHTDTRTPLLVTLQVRAAGRGAPHDRAVVGAGPRQQELAARHDHHKDRLPTAAVPATSLRDVTRPPAALAPAEARRTV